MQNMFIDENGNMGLEIRLSFTQSELEAISEEFPHIDPSEVIISRFTEELNHYFTQKSGKLCA